jgi:hypothetical protein
MSAPCPQDGATQPVDARFLSRTHPTGSDQIGAWASLSSGTAGMP